MSANIAKIANITRFFLLAKNTHDKYRKNRKNNKSNKNQDLEKKEAKKGPEMFANIAKIANITRFFLLAKNTHYKYRKNRKNNKSNKILDLENKKPRRTPKCPQISQKSQILLFPLRKLREQFASKFLLTRSILDISDNFNENVSAPISEESWLHHFKSRHSIDPTNSTHEHEIHRELYSLEHEKEQFTHLDYEITEREIR